MVTLICSSNNEDDFNLTTLVIMEVSQSDIYVFKWDYSLGNF